MAAIDTRDFYIQASSRLLGTTCIEQAFQDCLLFLREHIPADRVALHLIDVGLGVIETVVDVTVERAALMSKITTLSPEARQMVQYFVDRKVPECEIVENPAEGEMTRQIGIDLDTPNAPVMIMELVLDDEFLGVVGITNTHGGRYTEEHCALVRAIHDPLAMVCSQFRRYRDLTRLQQVLADNARQLQQDLMHDIGDEVVGADFGLKQVMDRLEQVAAQNSSVLLLGETGVGKEVIAWAVHRLSPRREGAFIKVNCGAIPPSLIESELFGHEKGAFTGAIARRRGCFERADGGTLLLDEVGELLPEAQVRLLRVLQDQRIERLGGAAEIRVDVRVLAATNRDLEAMVREGRFRQDLYFRLNVFPILIPPLRERTFDIPALAHHLIIKKAREMGLPGVPPTETGAIDRLTEYDWPGNVRELQNIIERELILRPRGPLTFADFRPLGSASRRVAPAAEEGESVALDQVLIRHITWALHRSNGKVEGPGGAAELLEVNPRTLQKRMARLGIPYGRKAKGVYAGGR